MNKTKFDHMEFQEGGCGSSTNIVGRKDLFKDEQDFLDFILEEYSYHFEDVEIKPTTDKVYVTYIRYYPHFPEDFSAEIESGYTFCNKAKGAIEVFCMDM